MFIVTVPLSIIQAKWFFEVADVTHNAVLQAAMVLVVSFAVGLTTSQVVYIFYDGDKNRGIAPPDLHPSTEKSSHIWMLVDARLKELKILKEDCGLGPKSPNYPMICEAYVYSTNLGIMVDRVAAIARFSSASYVSALFAIVVSVICQICYCSWPYADSKRAFALLIFLVCLEGFAYVMYKTAVSYGKVYWKYIISSILCNTPSPQGEGPPTPLNTAAVNPTPAPSNTAAITPTPTIAPLPATAPLPAGTSEPVRVASPQATAKPVAPERQPSPVRAEAPKKPGVLGENEDPKESELPDDEEERDGAIKKGPEGQDD
jgi:hypothetical protein